MEQNTKREVYTGAWLCTQCGRQKGDFKLLGSGLVKCSGCGAIYFIGHNGEPTVMREGKEELKTKYPGITQVIDEYAQW